MNKKEFLDFFNLDDKLEASKIYEKYKLTDYGLSTFTESFYPPSIWAKIIKMKNTLKINVDTYGGFFQSERRIVMFEGEYPTELPVKFMCVKNLSKFKDLAHKDYLGAIMSLGIKREKMGDLIVKENCCYFPVFEDVARIIERDLESVGHNPVEIFYVEELVEEVDFEEITIVVSSQRLDSIVSALTKLSREEAVKQIEKGEVFINYSEEKEKSLKLKEDDIISIRKYGKYKFDSLAGNTKKDKLRIVIKKFI